MARAYTRIDHGGAVLGNDWLERRWSAFLGTTVELRQKLARGYVEWIAVPGPDFLLEAGGVPVTPERLGPVEWSESFNAFGGTISARRAGPGLVVDVRTTALHDLPAMVREVSVLNTGEGPVAVAVRGVDRLGLRRDGAGVLYGNPAVRAESATVRGGIGAAELRGHGRLGLLMGIEPSGTLALFEPDHDWCLSGAAHGEELPPGACRVFGVSFLIPYEGDPAPVSGAPLAALLRRLREPVPMPEEGA